MQNKKLFFILGGVASICLAVCLVIAGVVLLVGKNEQNNNKKYIDYFSSDQGNIPQGFTNYELKESCSSFGANLKLESFKVAHPNDFEAFPCSIYNNQNYLSLFVFDKENLSYNAYTNPLFNVNVVFGFFEFNEVKTYSAYTSLSDQLMTSFVDSLESNIGSGNKVEEINSEDVKIEDLTLISKEYKLSIINPVPSFKSGTYEMKIVLIPNFDSGYGVMYAYLVHQDFGNLNGEENRVIIPMLKSFRFNEK